MNQPASSPRDPFELLIEEHQDAVWRYLRFLGCDPTAADDLTQETFLAVVGRPVHRFGAGGARAYLRRVARNHFVQLRKRRGLPLSDLDVAEAAWDWYAEADDGARKREALRACLASLDSNARLALELRHRDGESRDGIAARVGIGAHGVKSLLQRSYAKLRACIERRLRRMDENGGVR